MNPDLEAASEAVNEAWREMIGLRMTEERDGQVLAGKHVDSLRKAQTHLLAGKAAISVALAHINTLLTNAGANGGGRVGARDDTLHRQLLEVRSRKRTL